MRKCSRKALQGTEPLKMPACADNNRPKRQPRGWGVVRAPRPTPGATAHLVPRTVPLRSTLASLRKLTTCVWLTSGLLLVSRHQRLRLLPRARPLRAALRTLGATTSRLGFRRNHLLTGPVLPPLVGRLPSRLLQGGLRHRLRLSRRLRRNLHATSQGRHRPIQKAGRLALRPRRKTFRLRRLKRLFTILPSVRLGRIHLRFRSHRRQSWC